MTSLEKALSGLLAQLDFDPEGGARFRGTSCTADESLDAGPDARRAGVRQWLSDHIYMRWHCGMPEFVFRRAQLADRIATREFVRGLSAANATPESWEAGWIVAGMDEGRVVAAARHGVRFVVSPDDVRIEGDPAPGVPCRVRLAGEQQNMLPGFYLALGAHTPAVVPERQVRVYWHLRNAGAIPLLGTLSRSLNAARIPYWLKLLSDPSDYTRADAAVLYLARDDMAAAAPLIMDAYAAVRGHLREPTSPFALTIAPGLAVAVDLPRSASFGQHRSQALATAIVDAAKDPMRAERPLAAEHVLEMMHARGIDPGAPYRHHDDLDPDRWSVWQGKVEARITTHPPVAPDDKPATAEAVPQARDLACEIAGWICDEAFVHDGMWNWMGADASVDEDEDELQMTYRALGPSMYDGTAGIALFLGEAWAATGHSRFADAARGAMRHALSRMESIPADTRRGFHTGMAGIAWVASRLGTLFGDRALVQQARDLALHIASDESPPPLLDVISGAAGTSVALLTLADDLSLGELRTTAERLGAAICAGATRSEAGWSWGANASGQEFARDLTGFAHGAAGIGWALCELEVATGTDEFVRGAREAMRYENRWYDAESGNWPDFRESDGMESPAPSMMAWCHGAPGILLSRLRAYQLLGDAEARIDLERGMRAVVEWLADPDVIAETSYTLCHGQLGVAECLLHASEILQDVQVRDAALAIAARGRAVHAGDPASWSPGLRRGRNPSLMLGQAGIGLEYLRMAAPEVPSVLLWGPASHVRRQA